MPHLLVWLDIPVRDLDRAVKFYAGVLEWRIDRQEFPGMAIGVFAHGDDDVAGCLFVTGGAGPSGESVRPSDCGPLAYFNCDGRLEEAVARVAHLGGEVLEPPHPIGPYGFRAIIKDSEGNRIALHSM